MKWSAIIFSTLFLSSPLVAQEQPEEGKEKEETKAKAAEVAQVKTEKDTGESDADDYEATEEVSEDLTVSYPVDI